MCQAGESGVCICTPMQQRCSFHARSISRGKTTHERPVRHTGELRPNAVRPAFWNAHPESNCPSASASHPAVQETYLQPPYVIGLGAARPGRNRLLMAVMPMADANGQQGGIWLPSKQLHSGLVAAQATCTLHPPALASMHDVIP
jgi:hypothetical protein